MAEVHLYRFESADGAEGTYTTFNYLDARDHAIRYKLKLIEETYEYSDSELVEDFTESE